MHYSLPKGKAISRATIKSGDSVNGWTLLDIPRYPQHKVLCRCECGSEHSVNSGNILQGLSRNCRACSSRRTFTTHGASDSGGERSAERIYRIWKAMKWRCNPKNTNDGELYHGRGITVCEEWAGDFVAFRDWAIANGYAEHLTIDRWPDKNGNYGPGNCRWSTPQEQARNTRRNQVLTAFGETKMTIEWALDSRCRVAYRTLHGRVKKGWGHQRAISTPPFGSPRVAPS